MSFFKSFIFFLFFLLLVSSYKSSTKKKKQQTEKKKKKKKKIYTRPDQSFSSQFENTSDPIHQKHIHIQDFTQDGTKENLLIVKRKALPRCFHITHQHSISSLSKWSNEQQIAHMHHQ